VVTTFSAGIETNSDVKGITAGPDGNIWFTEETGRQIGRITTSGQVTEFRFSAAPAQPMGITAGPDGNLWFTDGFGKIWRMTPDGTSTAFAIGTPQADPTSITAGPDGNLWFTDTGTNSIGKMTTTGVATEYPIGSPAPSDVVGLAAAPDGTVWFTQDQPAEIGRITPQGSVTEFSTGISAGASLGDIAIGVDGNLYFTEYVGNQIGEITPSGVITEIPLPQGEGPLGITAGPDGSMWFTDNTLAGFGSIGPVGYNPTGPTPTRIAGMSRIGTAIDISQKDFPLAGTAKAVVLSRSDVFADALAGAPLAAKVQGPLLLNSPTTLDPAVATEIQRVLPRGGTVYMLGGSGALATAVESAVVAAGYTVVRYAGQNRDATAVQIAQAGLGNPTTVLLTTGLSPFDALSAGAAAAKVGAAILLTDGTNPSPATSAYLAAHPASVSYAIGGPAAIADPAARALVGANRDATSVLVASTFFPDAPTLAFAWDGGFADALSGGPDAARSGAPVLLIPTVPPPSSATTSYLFSERGKVTSVVFYGGSGVLSDFEAMTIQNEAT